MPEFTRLRTLLIADDGRKFEDMSEWIDWLLERDWNEKNHILDLSQLNSHQCRSLWKWLGRTDKVPQLLDILGNIEDAEHIDQERKEQGLHWDDFHNCYVRKS